MKNKDLIIEILQKVDKYHYVLDSDMDQFAEEILSVLEYKEAEEMKTAEEREKIFAKMQQDFQPTLETPFKQGMYSGYAFGLQDGYKFASQSLPEISDEDIEKAKDYQNTVNTFSGGAKWYRDELKRRLK